jgi:UDP-N-acetylglucosamine 2-epimerase (non-hydrolysing)
VRLIASKLSPSYYCGGRCAVNNVHALAPRGAIIDTGFNTTLDSLRFAVSLSPCPGVSPGPYCVVSIHTAENLLNRPRFGFLLRLLMRLSERIPARLVLQPATKRVLQKSAKYDRLAGSGTLELLDRTPYVRFVQPLQGARFLLTGGGSNQEKASYLGLPRLLLRKHTERTEGLGDDVTLSGYEAEAISAFVDRHLDRIWEPKSLPEIYPSKAIVDHLESLLSGASR